MRLTTVVHSMHIGNTFKQIWKVQNKRKVLDYGVRQNLESKGLQVVDAVQFLNLKRATPTVVPLKAQPSDGTLDESLIPKPLQLNQTHPDWHDQPCRKYDDHSSVLTGINEGLHITKTCLVSNSLPHKIDSYRSKTGYQEVHQKIKQAILNAHTLDALQVKLPREVDRTRPVEVAWRLPRSYGLPKWRRNVQLLSKMFHAIDMSLAKENIDVCQNQFTSEISVKTPLTLESQPFLFETRHNQLVFGRKALQPYVDGTVKEDFLAKPLPSIYPLSRTISISENNIYRLETLFPLRQGAPYDRLAMAIFHINEPVVNKTETQLQARLLLHSFGVAAAYAQYRYGKDIKELPEPLTINCVQTDSRNFYFGCLQLHSLDLDSSKEAHNLFWADEPKAMFEKCDYVNGQPVLKGYNPEVVETLMALYRSQMTAA